MNKEIRISLIDLYIGYACSALLMYAIGGVAYSVGRTKGKLEVTNKIQEAIEHDQCKSRNLQSV